MNNARKDSEKNDGNLRRALARMLLESAPADGWEERVLEAADRSCRRRRVFARFMAFGAAAVAAAVVAVVFLPRNPAAGPSPAAAPSVVGAAPAPVAVSVVGRPVAAPPAAPAAAAPAPAPGRKGKPRVIIPEAGECGTAEPSDIDIPIGEYIDDLLAMELIRNQELLTSITD